MNLRDELERLQQQHETLSRSIKSIDDEVDRAGRALLNGDGSGRLLEFLQERQNAQLGFMYELGKLDSQIERVELLAREELEQRQEQRVAERWQENQPLAREDHLDWFKQSLAENPPNLDDVERAEQDMLQAMEREQPENHLDWFQDRS